MVGRSPDRVGWAKSPDANASGGVPTIQPRLRPRSRWWARREGAPLPTLRLLKLQLPRIAERERTHPPRILIQNQRPGDRRFGALAAVFALAQPAVDADRRALGFLQVDAGGVDQPRGGTDFTAQAGGEARLRVRGWRHRPPH